MKRLGILIVAVGVCFPLSAGDLYIPAAARLTGGNGTVFRTDVRIVNLTAAGVTVKVEFLPTNTSNLAPQGVDVPVSGRSSAPLDDVLGNLFGADGTSGALRFSSDSLFAVTSRTYTPMVDCPGTAGQFIPALETADATARSVLSHVQLSAVTTSGFRTNVGALNPGGAEVNVNLKLRSGEGSLLGTGSFTLLPYGQTQTSVAQLFGVQTLSTDNAFIEVEASGPVIAYASAVDNLSGDSMYIPAVPDPIAAPSNDIDMIARQWTFEPSTIEVRAGEPVTIRVRAIDVDHGISFSGVGPFTCSSDQAGQCILAPNEVVTVTFTPAATGSFAFFCTRFCGDSPDGTHGHLTMRGTVIVK